MWRWIAAVTVLVATFGLGMWSALCLTSGFHVELTTTQTLPTPFSNHDEVMVFPAANVPSYSPVEESAPLSPEAQKIVEIAQARPSAASGTMFDDSTNRVAFVEALAEIAEEDHDAKLEPQCLAPQCQKQCDATGSEPTSLGVQRDPLVVHDATCDGDEIADSVPSLTLCTPETCPQVVNPHRELADLLYQRAKEFDTQAWRLEDAGDYEFADRMRHLAEDLRLSARVAASKTR